MLGIRKHFIKMSI